MFQTRPLPLPINIPFTSSSSSAHSHSPIGLAEIIPSEDELVLALSHERNKNPEMGVGKLVENVRFVKGWSVGEKRVKKVSLVRVVVVDVEERLNADCSVLFSSSSSFRFLPSFARW